MRYPFPIHRTNTITRKNITTLRRDRPKITNAADICVAIVGTIPGKEEKVKKKMAKLIERCEKLMV